MARDPGPVTAGTRAPDDPYGNPDPEPAWLGVDWSEHTATIDVVGARVNYAEMGTGPPLLLVHGLAGSWQNFLENMIPLAATHRVLALDLPGFGASPSPQWDISIPAYGRLLRDFCERLGLDRVSLIGSSMGGFIATELAIAEPERVERLALVSAAGVTWARARSEPAAVAGRMARAAAPLLFRFQMEGLRRPRARRLAFRGVFHDPNALNRALLWEQTVPAMNCPGFYDALTSLVGYDIRHRLTEIEEPTAIIWGANDRVVPVRAASQYRELIGDNAEVHIFERCGHLPMLERPVRFNRLMEEFLSS